MIPNEINEVILIVVLKMSKNLIEILTWLWSVVSGALCVRFWRCATRSARSKFRRALGKIVQIERALWVNFEVLYSLLSLLLQCCNVERWITRILWKIFFDAARKIRPGKHRGLFRRLWKQISWAIESRRCLFLLIAFFLSRGQECQQREKMKVPRQNVDPTGARLRSDFDSFWFCFLFISPIFFRFFQRRLTSDSRVRYTRHCCPVVVFQFRSPRALTNTLTRTTGRKREVQIGLWSVLIFNYVRLTSFCSGSIVFWSTVAALLIGIHYRRDFWRSRSRSRWRRCFFSFNCRL